MKRKFEEIGCDTREEREAGIEQPSLIEIEDHTIGANEEGDHEVPLIERFWQLLATADYDCW